MKASDLFVRCLEAQGVRRIFGVPGEENAAFMMSLEKSEIDFVLCRHEQSAAFMADVHGRLTGEAGVCLSTLGPGASNLVTGVADANMDRAPLVAITGQAGLDRRHKESHQNMDVVGMFEPITPGCRNRLRWPRPCRRSSPQASESGHRDFLSVPPVNWPSHRLGQARTDWTSPAQWPRLLEDVGQ